MVTSSKIVSVLAVDALRLIAGMNLPFSPFQGVTLQGGSLPRAQGELLSVKGF